MSKKWIVAAAAVLSCVFVLNQLRAQTPATKPAGAAAPAAAKETAMPKETPPRKIVVGSLMHSMYSGFPGVEKRCQDLSGFVDDMAKKAKEKYGVGLDLVALPEVAVNGGMKGDAKAISQPLDGTVMNILGAAAKKNHCYITVPLFYTEDAGKTKLFNILALVDREGKVAGIYKKVHAVGSLESPDLEGGCLPGKDFPIFQCDFGKLGMQICYDMAYDDGWETLARKGAELVVWSTQSPQIISMQARSHKHHYYTLSSTWRNNITLVDPTGAVIAQSTTPSTTLLVEQIDLSYALVGWQGKLGNGQAFVDKYGKNTVGYRYSEAEDGGIFWSNDPNIPVMKMVRELGLEMPNDEIARNKVLQDKLRGGPPSLE
jgi:predicted amidohydrolase